AGGFERRFHVLGVFLADLVAMILEHLFDLVDHRVGAIARVDLILAPVIVGGVGFGVLGHLVDFVLAEAGGRRDGDLLLVVGGLVLGRHIENAVGIDVEGDFN